VSVCLSVVVCVCVCNVGNQTDYAPTAQLPANDNGEGSLTEILFMETPGFNRFNGGHVRFFHSHKASLATQRYSILPSPFSQLFILLVQHFMSPLGPISYRKVQL
jgi:hypothetical protein